MNKSEIAQRRCGTLDRNREIKNAYLNGMLQVKLAKKHGMSKQAISVICQRDFIRDSFFWRLIGNLRRLL